jgi:hypothetical protein
MLMTMRTMSATVTAKVARIRDVIIETRKKSAEAVAFSTSIKTWVTRIRTGRPWGHDVVHRCVLMMEGLSAIIEEVENTTAWMIGTLQTLRGVVVAMV